MFCPFFFAPSFSGHSRDLHAVLCTGPSTDTGASWGPPGNRRVPRMPTPLHGPVPSGSHGVLSLRHRFEDPGDTVKLEHAIALGDDVAQSRPAVFDDGGVDLRSSRRPPVSQSCCSCTRRTEPRHKSMYEPDTQQRERESNPPSPRGQRLTLSLTDVDDSVELTPAEALQRLMKMKAAEMHHIDALQHKLEHASQEREARRCPAQLAPRTGMPALAGRA